jgi:5-methylcytosine-specific restriction protein A
MAWSRQSRHERGYGSDWDKTRARILKRDRGLCIPCLMGGRPAPATQVDHIKPKAKGGTDADDNLQSICDDCHKAKTAADEGRTLKRSIGLDGWPA